MKSIIKSIIEYFSVKHEVCQKYYQTISTVRLNGVLVHGLIIYNDNTTKTLVVTKWFNSIKLRDDFIKLNTLKPIVKTCSCKDVTKYPTEITTNGLCSSVHWMICKKCLIVKLDAGALAVF